MPKWRFKACVRCRGDVFIDRDIDGWFEQCLQCSCRRELKEFQYHGTPITVAAKLVRSDEEEKSDGEN